MNNKQLLRGIFLMIFALACGIQASTDRLGLLSRPGAGFFPLMVSSLLFLIGLITAVRSRYTPALPMAFNPKNIAVVLGSLVGFVLVSQLTNMVAGIAFLVFFSSLAASSYSWQRNLKVVAGLLAIAFAFQKLLGLNLPLL